MGLSVSEYVEYKSVSLEKLHDFPKWEVLEFLLGDKNQVQVVIGKPASDEVREEADDPYDYP